MIYNFLRKILDISDFTPRWHCGNWSDFLGWLYIISNLAIWAAYFTIPLMMLRFIYCRKDIPFQKIFIWFILFIFFCGTSHLTDSLMFWWPLYRLNAIMLAITAVVSWCTVLLLYKALPQAIELGSPAQLQKIIDEQTTTLVLANKKLKESEQQFKALVDNNPDIITKISKNHVFQFVNHSITKVVAQPPESFIGKTPAEMATDKNNARFFVGKIDESIASGQNISYETSVTAADNKVHYFYVDIIPLKEEDGSIENVLTVTKNITRQKENEITLTQTILDLDAISKRIENKRRILEDFSYVVSHNLRSPVYNLEALIKMRDEENDPGQKEYYMDLIKQVSQKLITTVQDLTEVVKIRQEPGIPKEKMYFKDVVEGQKEAVSAMFVHLNVQMTTDFSRCEDVEYPKIYLESIVLNLLTNAIKYASPDRTPAIHFQSGISPEGIISLSCTDNGQGIDLEKYGDKLFGLHKTFHNHPDARGVGLFFTKNQVEVLGGTIKVKSKVNEGSVFTVYFNGRPDEGPSAA